MKKISQRKLHVILHPIYNHGNFFCLFLISIMVFWNIEISLVNVSKKSLKALKFYPNFENEVKTDILITQTYLNVLIKDTLVLKYSINMSGHKT